MRIQAAGVIGAIFRAVSSADLSDEQRETLGKIATDLRANTSDGGARGEAKEAHDELAAGVKAGKVDVSKIESHEAVASGRE